MPDLNLIELENSTPGNRKIISADELMYNFHVLEKKAGTALYTTLIESTGVTYNPLLEDQLAKAVVQYVLGAYLFDVNVESTNYYVLTPKTGYYAPNSYTDGMKVTFYNEVANTTTAYIRIDGVDGTTYYEIRYNNTSLEAGDLPTNTYVTLMFKVATDPITGQAIKYFDLGESGNVSSVIENIDNILETTITAAGFTYNQKNKAQLLETIAAYVYGTVLQVDTTNTSGSTYLLYTLPRITATQKLTKITPIVLERGQIYSFIPHVDNTSETVRIVINNSTTLTANLLNNDGSPLKIGQLKANILSTFYVDTVVDENNQVISTSFKLCTGTLPFLTLNSKTITNISTDHTFNTASDEQLATSKAIKEYIDVATSKSEPNSVAQSTLDSVGNSAILHQVGDSTVEVLADVNKYKNIEKTTIDFPFNSGTPTVTASSTATGSGDAVNVISNGVGTTWQSGLTGYAIDGWARKVIQPVENDPTSRIVVKDGSTQTTTPDYLQFVHLYGKPDIIKFQHIQGTPVPSKIQLLINLNSNWYPLCDENKDIETYTQLTTDSATGVSVLQVPNYYDDGSVSAIALPSTLSDYALRLCVYDFDDAQVYDAGYLANILDISTYNPVSDFNSGVTRYRWEVQGVELLQYDNLIKPAVVTFYDNTTYEFTSNVKNTILDTDSTTGKLISHTKPGTYYAVLSTAGAGSLLLVDKTDGYFIQNTDPLIKTGYYGGKLNTCWVDTSAGTPVMRIASPTVVTVTEGEDHAWYFTYNDVEYVIPNAELPASISEGDTFYIYPVTVADVTTPHIYVPDDNPHANNSYKEDFDFYMDNITDTESKFIIVGEVTLTEDTSVSAPYSVTKISAVLSYNTGYERELTTTYTATANTYNSVTLTHNFGAGVTTRVLLECTEADNGIQPGTCYELAPYRVDNVTTTTTSVVSSVDFTNESTGTTSVLTSASANQNSFFLISSNKNTILLGYKNLGFYDVTGTWTTPTSGKWKFVAEVNKRLS